MKITINLPDALIPQIDARDLGKGRSEVIQRLLLRYIGAVHQSLRTAHPGPETLRVVENAVRHGIGEAEAEIMTEDLLGRLALLDAAERAVAATDKKGENEG